MWKSLASSYHLHLWWEKGEMHLLAGGFKLFFIFTPIPGEMVQFDYYFHMG